MEGRKFHTMCVVFLWRIALFAVLVSYIGTILGEDTTTEYTTSMKESDKIEENTSFVNFSNNILTLTNMTIIMLCDKFNYSTNSPEVLMNVLKFYNCLRPIFNIETLQTEIVEARQNYTKLDGIIGRYCVSADDLKVCLQEVLVGLLPCTPALLRKYEYVLENASYSAIEWLCSDNGTRMERFIEENGKDCIQEQIPEAMECLNAGTNSSTTTTPSLRINMSLTEKCGKLDAMMACNLNKLKHCSSNITAEIATSLFSYVRGVSPCRDVSVNLDQIWEYDTEDIALDVTSSPLAHDPATEPAVMSGEL